MNALVEACDLRREFVAPPRRTRRMYAVNGVSFSIRRGEIVGLVGESGSGKSTIARLLLRLSYPTSGKVLFDGTDLALLPSRDLRAMRRRMQIVFQDPFSSLDPRVRAQDSLLEPLRIQRTRLTKDEQSRKVSTLLEQVGLPRETASRYPHELSGGQCQRLSIARALALEPELLILDEPTAALDVSVQAQIVCLLERLRKERQLTMLFISHDLSLVNYFCDRMVVLYFGKVMECLPVGAAPRHHYTRFLRENTPALEPRKLPLPAGTVAESPSQFTAPQGCVYAPRCPSATELCRRIAPPEVADAHGQVYACHHPLA